MQPIFPETTLDKSVVLFYNKCKNPGAAAAAGNAVFRLKEYMRDFMYTYFIADDETKIRQGLRRLIDWEDLGFFCVGEASNGEDALAVILEKKPDIALLDIRMPRLSGLDVARLAREKNYEGTILILSGYSDFKYAQEAMCYDVKFYITKPVDEDDLTAHLLKIREELDEKKKRTSAIEYYSEKARSSILRDFLTGSSRTLTEELKELGLLSGCYQAAIYEKYSHDAAAVSYRFSDLLHLTNEDNHSYETLTIDHNEIILLKGDFAIRRFSEFVERFEREVKPQKGSPLDSLFITYGRVVYRPEDITGSYREALYLLQMRFYCDPGQHTFGYHQLARPQNSYFIPDKATLEEYRDMLVDYIQTRNRRLLAETLGRLREQIYLSSVPIEDIRRFFLDLYLQVREAVRYHYHTADIPFPPGSWAADFINTRYYLYEIITFISEQTEMILRSLGTASRESTLDNVIYYIRHNYMNNLKLERIAPLFGYNSSYLGKLFTQKIGMNFTAYLDRVRIDASLELLKEGTLKVYEIAEKVGYSNVDYFHTKFKKVMGESPAEYRRKLR